MNYPFKPGSSSVPQVPILPGGKGPPDTGQGEGSLPELEAHARIIKTNLDVLVQMSEVARKTIFADLAAKIKELSLKEAAVADIDLKIKNANEIAAKIFQKQKLLEDERTAFDSECIKARKSIQDERTTQLQEKIQYALPKFLGTEDARPTLGRIQPIFDTGSEGKQLQIFLSVAAVAEELKDFELFMTALLKMFPLLRDLDAKLAAADSTIVGDITVLINKGNEFGIEVKAPKKRDGVIDAWMNPPVGVKIVSEIYSWAIWNKEKVLVRKAIVK